MADTVVTFVDGRTVVQVAGSALLAPLVSSAAASAAAAQASAAAAAADAAAIDIPAADDRFRVTDPFGHVLFEVSPEGIKNGDYETVKAMVETRAGLLEAGDQDVFRVMDPKGFVAFAIRANGEMRNADYQVTKALAGTAPGVTTDLALVTDAVESLVVGNGRSTTQRDYRIVAELAHILFYGQSLSIGTRGSPALSTTPLSGSWAKMFAVVRDRDPAQDYSSLNDLVESDDADSTHGETGAYAAAEMIAQLLADEDGITISASGQQMLFSAPGEGSKSVVDLSEGSTWFDRLSTDVSSGNDRADAAGKSYLLHALIWMQGEEDYLDGTPADAYKLSLRALADEVRAEALAITGVDRPVPFIFSQLASHRFYGSDPTIAEALLDMAEQEDFALSAPHYFLTHYTDGRHLINTSYRTIGGYHGIALKRWLFDGVKPRWLKPLEPTWLDRSVVIPFDPPSGEITFDTVAVSNPGNYGFSLVDNAGSAIAISSVTIAGNRVCIRAAAAIPVGSQVRYAWGDNSMTATGPTGGARGCLRDTQGDTITFHGVAMHNWSPIFHFTRA